jgi:hypothetical protein
MLGITLLIHLLACDTPRRPGCDAQLFISNDGQLRERSIGEGRIKPVLRFKKAWLGKSTAIRPLFGDAGQMPDDRSINYVALGF